MKLKPEHFYQAKQNGINYQTLHNRVNNHDWDIDRAITKPVRKKRNNPMEVKSEKELIIEELNALGYYRTDGKTLKELSTALALHQIKAESSHSTWF